MKTITTFKRGDTLAFTAIMTDKSGQSIVGSAINLKADLRTYDDEKIAEFLITETVTSGTYLFSIADTSNFPIDTLYTDIQYADNGIITSSETLAIVVQKDITL